MSTKKFDIVAIVKNNPLARLSSDYGSKIVSKITECFTLEEQQLFVANVYGYLNYDPRKDFVIDLDPTWKWMGFGKKSDCKSLLVNNFTLDIDYKIELEKNKVSIEEDHEINFEACAALKTKPLTEPKNEETRGRKNETILLTIHCFKKLCLKAKTKNSDQICKIHGEFEQTPERHLHTKGCVKC